MTRGARAGIPADPAGGTGGFETEVVDVDAELFRLIARARAAGEAVALATIVRTRGHAPRGVGSKMAVFADGRALGTIGGGCGEAEVRRVALDVLQGEGPTLYTVDLTGDFSDPDGAICGGRMDVFVERLHPHPQGG